MPKDEERKELTQEEIDARDEKFRTFFTTSVAQVPEEMTRGDDGPAEKPKGLFGRLFRREKTEPQADGAVAQPPRAVSRSSAGRRFPTVYTASSISSNGISCRTPERAISAAIVAFATPAALRFWQGYSTSPPTGSQTRPSIFIRTVDAAARDCSGDPPISSTVADAAIADAIPTSA